MRGFGLQWHLTNECDQRCKHCYIWQKHDKLGFNTTPSIRQCEAVIADFTSFCGEMGVIPYFSITGGDPLLYPLFWNVLELLKERGTGFSILGNPFHLTHKVAKRLKDLGCVSYQMSIDGKEKTHDSMRKPGSFVATLSAIPILNESGIRSMIMSTVSLLNYKELPDIARLCVKHKVGNFAFARYCPVNGDAKFNMSPKLYRSFLEKMWKVYMSNLNGQTNFALKDHLWKAYLYEEGLIELPQNTENLIMDGCGCGIRHMTLLPNGTVYACRRFDSIVGKIGDQTFKEIFLSAEMDKYRQVQNIEGCNKCELLNYCRGCPAVSVGTTGCFFKKDPQCWR
jgi:radical SAM/SPASM domain protein of ACGX system